MWKNNKSPICVNQVKSQMADIGSKLNIISQSCGARGREPLWSRRSSSPTCRLWRFGADAPEWEKGCELSSRVLGEMGGWMSKGLGV